MSVTSEMKNAPPLYGWVLAKAAAIAAFGIGYLVIDLEFMGAAMVSVVIWLVVGLIFTIAEAPKGASAMTAAPEPKVTSMAAPAPTVAAAPAPEPAAAAPVPMAPAPNPTPAPEIAATAAPVAMAAADAPAPQAESVAEVKPAALSGPIGAADDLKKINGVGPVLEGKLNGLGVYHFWQIARWSDAEVAWVDGFLNFKGRIGRDNWITQAGNLAATSPAKPPR